MGYSDLVITKYVVAAIVGCWWRESGVNPAIWESRIPCAWDYQYEYDHKGGFGLGQWTNIGTKYGRLWELHVWCDNNNFSEADGNAQLLYVLVENHWVNTPSPRLGYTTLTDFLQSTSTNVDDLVYDFLACWEGVEGDHYSERCGYAADALAYINLHENDPDTWTWVAMNNYLTESQTLNNVMVVYHFMVHNEIPPVPPTPIERVREKGMPLWMMLRTIGKY